MKMNVVKSSQTKYEATISPEKFLLRKKFFCTHFIWGLRFS